MSYAIVLTNRARKQLADLGKKTQAAVAQAIEDLAQGLNPNCKKLAGIEHAYRLRVGDYRVVFQVDCGRLVIVVIKIAHRKDVYR